MGDALVRTIIALVIVVLLVGGAVAYYATQIAGDSSANFRTVKVTQGDLPDDIDATGTVEPEEVVDVGAQVAGRIESLGPDYRRPKRRADDKATAGKQVDGKADQTKTSDSGTQDAGKADVAGGVKSGSQGRTRNYKSKPGGFSPSPEDRSKFDTIDYTSMVHGPILKEGKLVKEGTLLAKIDDAVYGAQCDAAEAARDRAKADLEQASKKFEQTDAELRRAEALRKLPPIPATKDHPPLKIISDSDYDLIAVNQQVAKANVAVAEAALKQAEASLELAETNLAYTVIRSPVDGVIIDRRVNVGQTVVASLNAPSLFLIAKDLKKMQVWASVNEADIGRIKPGCAVTFTVDAFPKDKFKGEVTQVRLNAQMTQNVVIYTVVVTFDNSDEKLKPYLTANVKFHIDTRRNVLLVPNAALRWRPRLEQVAPDERAGVAAILSRKGGPEGQAPGQSPDAAAGKPTKDREERGRLWVQDGKFVRPIEVQIGASDGTLTEVAGDKVTKGMEVVMGEGRKEAAGGDDTTNPFAPKLFKGKK